MVQKPQAQAVDGQRPLIAGLQTQPRVIFVDYQRASSVISSPGARGRSHPLALFELSLVALVLNFILSVYLSHHLLVKFLQCFLGMLLKRWRSIVTYNRSIASFREIWLFSHWWDCFLGPRSGVDPFAVPGDLLASLSEVELLLTLVPSCAQR